MWLASSSNGVFRIGDDGKARQYAFDELSGYISSVFVDSRGCIWAVSHIGTGAVMRYDKTSDTFKSFGSDTFVCRALTITEDDNHNMWLGTWEQGLICFSPVTAQVLYRTSAVDRHYFTHVHTLLRMPDGRMLVGSDAGLTIFDMTSTKIKHYVNNVFDPYSLSDNFIYPLTLDAEGGIWIGTYYGGVNYLRPDLKNFVRLQPGDGVNSIGCNIVSDIKEDAHGDIWVASDDGGLKRYTPDTGTCVDVPLNDVGHGVNPLNLHSLCFDGDDLWVGSYAMGVYVYNVQSGNIRHYTSSDTDVTTLMSASSYAIYRDRRSVIWVATNNWANLYLRGTDNFRRVKDLKAQIVDIKEDVDGSLWFATQGAGLWRYDPVKGDWRNFRYEDPQHSLAHNHVNCICIGSQGTVYAATVHGLCRYVRATETFEPIVNGIPMTSVLAAVEDGHALWLTTEIGLVKYVEGEGCQVFNKSDGLSSASFLPKSILRTASGKIYVGTRSGITAFYPYQIKSNNIVPQVVFTGLEIPNEINQGMDGYLDMDLNHIDCVVLHPEDYTFSITFAALSYTNPEKNQYAYMLDGFDKDWIKVGADNRVTYTNLPPGQYTFRVKGSNSDNIWNEDGASLNIEVLAPWYATLPMRMLYVLLAIGAMYMLVRAIMRRNNKKHEIEIHRINSDKEIELYQAKLSFFTMIAHEIRTPVSLIIGPIEQILRSPEKVSKSMSQDLNIIERNSQRLLTLVNQLLDFKKVEESGISLRFTNVKLKPIVMAVVDRFRPSLEQKSITLTVNYGVDDDFTADVDAEGLTKLLSNLLNNARKFTKDSVSVSVATTDNGKSVIIKVADNGVGISKDNLGKIFRPFYQVDVDESRTRGGTGLGLSIVQSVVDGHGGDIKVESELNLGTTFIVSLPVHQAVVCKPDVKEDISNDKAVHEPAVKIGAHDDHKPVMLVVEDNEELCQFVADSFEVGYHVIMAHDGIEALDVLKSNEVSFIISDWMMPRLDGAELCKAVRADRNISHIPFILLTAKTDNMSRIEGLNIGADAYIDKPFSLQVLHARVDNLLNMRALLRKQFSETPLQPLASVAPNVADNEILTQLTSIIEDNFANSDLDIDFLAEKLNISRSGLYNKIKSLVDTTPNELIRITRLKHAAKLLADGKYRINEVCYMVGFNNSSYFSKCFFKQFGVTPSEFVSNNSPTHD